MDASHYHNDVSNMALWLICMGILHCYTKISKKVCINSLVTVCRSMICTMYMRFSFLFFLFQSIFILYSRYSYSFYSEDIVHCYSFYSSEIDINITLQGFVET